MAKFYTFDIRNRFDDFLGKNDKDIGKALKDFASDLEGKADKLSRLSQFFSNKNITCDYDDYNIVFKGNEEHLHAAAKLGLIEENEWYCDIDNS